MYIILFFHILRRGLTKLFGLQACAPAPGHVKHL